MRVHPPASQRSWASRPIRDWGFFVIYQLSGGSFLSNQGLSIVNQGIGVFLSQSEAKDLSFPMRPWFRAPGMDPKSLPSSWDTGVLSQGAVNLPLPPQFSASRRVIVGVGTIWRLGQRICGFMEVIGRPTRWKADVQASLPLSGLGQAPPPLWAPLPIQVLMWDLRPYHLPGHCPVL